MNYRWKWKPLVFLPAVIVMCMIFLFSSQNGTESRSIGYRASERVVKRVNTSAKRGWSKKEIRKIVRKTVKVLRKCAHAAEYFVLAFTLLVPLYLYDMRGRRLYAVTLIFCICFALLDEFHQFFVPGRNASAVDVLVDSAGAAAGAFVAGLYLKRLSDSLTRAGVFLYLQSVRRLKSVRFLKETESTNTVLSEMAKEGAEDGTVVIADHQTGGMGRLGRKFHSPAGKGIYLSYLISPGRRHRPDKEEPDEHGGENPAENVLSPALWFTEKVF